MALRRKSIPYCAYSGVICCGRHVLPTAQDRIDRIHPGLQLVHTTTTSWPRRGFSDLSKALVQHGVNIIVVVYIVPRFDSSSRICQLIIKKYWPSNYQTKYVVLALQYELRIALWIQRASA
jgi:hypothetical protein